MCWGRSWYSSQCSPDCCGQCLACCAVESSPLSSHVWLPLTCSLLYTLRSRPSTPCLTDAVLSPHTGEGMACWRPPTVPASSLPQTHSSASVCTELDPIITAAPCNALPHLLSLDPLSSSLLAFIVTWGTIPHSIQFQEKASGTEKTWEQ